MTARTAVDNIVRKPAQSYKAVEAIADTLAADATIVTTDTYWIDDADHVYKHAHPDELPERFIVVRERIDVGGKIADHSKRDDVMVQIMCATKRRLPGGLDNPNAHKWLQALHRRVYNVIVGQVVSGALMATRIEQLPSAGALDVDNDLWFSTALYGVLMDYEA